MDTTVLLTFVVVYLGMVFGGLPRLALDRTGVALLGAIVVLVTGRLTLRETLDAVDWPTIVLLFALMVVSAQLRLGGFYAAVTRRLARQPSSPPLLLAKVIAAVGALSALLANDIVCLAVTPVLCEICARRRLAPVPFLLGLACAANVGSAATLIGNPQNMLIGQTLNLSFNAFLLDAAVPAILGLVFTWWVIVAQFRGRWEAVSPLEQAHDPLFNPWQTVKGLGILAGIVLAFLFTAWPRELVALAGAGMLLGSRSLHSRDKLGLVDWQLLVLFIGLFAVNQALVDTSMVSKAMEGLARTGVDLRHPAWLFVVTVPLSNLVSNVPAVMLLLPAATHPLAGTVLALSSTLAGNLLIVGSIANIIVVDQAARFGQRVSWAAHARTGVPVTLGTLALAAGWLWLRSTILG